MTKRKATNEIGGKSARPILIASQVEPQMRQSAIQAVITAKEIADVFGVAVEAVFMSDRVVLNGYPWLVKPEYFRT